MKQTRFCAVILAAGESSRMGKLKPLLPLGPRTVVERVVSLFQEAGVDDIVVVIGHGASQLLPVLEDSGARLVLNRRYRDGMFSSITAGIGALPDGCQAFFVMPVDTPLVRPQTIKDLLAAFGAGPAPIIYPVLRGKRGHPPLISTRLAREILGGDGAGGLSALLRRHDGEAREVVVADENIWLDFDTPKDYLRLLDRYRRYDIPTEAECLVLLTDKFRVEAPLLRHCRAVSGLAQYLAAALNECGCGLDLELIAAAGLLHDIARRQQHHARAGAEMLERLGYHRVAALVAAHMDIDLQAAGPIDARQVVYLADKLVEGDQVVSLEGRFGDKLLRARADAETAIGRRFENALEIKNRVENLTGKPLEELLAGFRKPAP